MQSAQPAQSGQPPLTPLARFVDSARGRVGAGIGAAVFLAAVVFFLFGTVVIGNGWPYKIDIDVYRLGAEQLRLTWADGGRSLYDDLPPVRIGSELLFTYPPIAAVLFVPFSWMPLAVATAAITATTLVCIAVVAMLIARALGAVDRGQLVRGAAVIAGFAVLTEPIGGSYWTGHGTLGYGQINLILMLLVLADVLPKRTPWPRGLLIGLAAAIKLTPAAYVLVLLVRRDWKSALTSVAGFAGFTALGAIAAPSDTWRYYSSELFATDRVGGFDYTGNQSLTAVLARFGLDDSARSALWLLLVAATLALTVVGMRAALRAGSPALALTLNALFALLASPISWSHHWVWAMLAVPALAVSGRRPLHWLAGIGAVLFVLGMQWWVPDHGFEWAWWQQIIGNGYVFWALAVMIAVPLSLRATAAPDPRPAAATAPPTAH